jgi:iron complex outermembrane receptor protein
MPTGSIGNSTNALGNELALAAAAANGLTIPPGSTAQVGFFTNGADTRTRGIDFALDYQQDLYQWGMLKWSFAGNQNETTITRYHAPTATLAAAGLTFFTPSTIDYLTRATPRNKFTLSPTWVAGNWGVTLRETRYGAVDDNFSYSSPLKYYDEIIKPAYITDLELGYQPTHAVRLALGVNNIFDKLPDPAPPFTRNARNLPYDSRDTPYGIDGTYFFGRISVSF